MNDRRDFLCGLGTSLGSIALSAMLSEETGAAEKQNPLAPRPGHHPAKATNCIFLMMEGGPSHIDTFDPKPKLKDYILLNFFGGARKSWPARSSVPLWD